MTRFKTVTKECLHSASEVYYFNILVSAQAIVSPAVYSMITDWQSRSTS